MEVIALFINNNIEIKGILLDKVHVKIFVNMLTISLYSYRIFVAMKVLNSFSLVSGLKLNLNKMQAMYLGAAVDHNIGNDVIDLGLKRSEKMDILRVVFFLSDCIN